MPNFNDIEPELCNYCGTCVGICPVSALSARDEKIIFDEKKCIKCGLCFQNCPGIKVDFNKIKKAIFNKNSKKNQFLGNLQGTYLGRTHDKNVISNASSGGIVTTLLNHLLENKLINGTIVVGSDPKMPWIPRAFIARTKEDVTKSQGSKYIMVPLNAVLKEISSQEGSFAMVGLPCHIHGIRNLQMNNHKAAKKIKYIIGVFCGFNVQMEATKFLIEKSGVELKDVRSLKYRAGKWPGGFEIITRKNKKTFLPKYYYDITDATFVPKRCLLCIDYMADLADIAIGDIWLSELNREKWSAVIVRTDTGKALLEKTKDMAEYRKIDENKIIKAHSHNINHKKRGAFFRMKLRKKKPQYNIEKPKLTIKENVLLSIPTAIFAITRTRIFRSGLRILPLKVWGKIAYFRRIIFKKTV